MFEEPTYHWKDPAWRGSAEAWIRGEVEQRGGAVTGPISGVRFLPWSAVLCAPTSFGDVYFKACGLSQRHEPALAAALAAARPDCMVAVLAADPASGRLLLADGGATLTDAIQTPTDGPHHWTRVLTLLAGVQRDMISRAGELLALVVPDRRPLVLPALFESIVARPKLFLVGEPGALTAAQLDNLQSLAPRVEELCVELAAIGPPDTYVHDDLHEDHVFAHRLPDGSWRYTFFDFGDACISHPFVQLVSQPRFAARRFESTAEPILSSLHESYLRYWQDFAPAAALNRALDIALALGPIIRAYTWVNACGDHLDEVQPFLRDAYVTRLAFWMLQVGERIEALDSA